MEFDSNNYKALALCSPGVEKVVSNELKKLNLTVVDTAFGRVRFSADLKGLYRALIGLRAADRVLLEMGLFRSCDFDALFNKAKAVHWEKLIPKDAGFKVVKVRTNRSKLSAETSIQSVVHKAAADRLCKSYGLSRLPDNDFKTAEVRVYIEKDMASLLLDLSGEPLFKRGYRKTGGTAPLRESTAAALLLLSGWKRKFPLYDPFCGSGTILAEALLYAYDAAPNLGRSFALNDFLIADKSAEDTVRNEFSSKINFERLIRVAGSDEDSGAAELALFNIKQAQKIAQRQRPEWALKGEAEAVLPKITGLPMQKAKAEDESCGFIITNPPYGKRLGDAETSERVYREMAVLARNFPNWKLAVISDHPGFESFFGRKADSCNEIKGGQNELFFYQYEKL